jgi:hypothetical protein
MNWEFCLLTFGNYRILETDSEGKSKINKDATKVDKEFSGLLKIYSNQLISFR